MLLIRPRNYKPPGGSAAASGEEARTPEQAKEPSQPSHPSHSPANPTRQSTYIPPPPPPVPSEHQQTNPRVESSASEKASKAPEAAMSAAEPSSEAASAPDVRRPDLPAIAASLERVLGRSFEVLQPISIGGMATLYQLRHRVHGGLFAVKVLHAFLADSPGVVAAFRREAIHAARLAGHPNMVPIFDLIELDGVPAMLMPYIEGEDLDRLLHRHGKFGRDEALMLAAQLASLLMYAETLGIVHGDLAPGNIRLDPFGQYRLLDFGLSRSSETEQEDQLPLAGTPSYNSPEQLRGEVPDIRTDLYSLGLILAEVLTGSPLIQASTLDELAACHLAGNWTLPPAVEADPPLARLIRNLVVADRAGRMSSAFELSGAIAAMGFELPSFDRSLSAGSHGLHPPRPRRRRLVAS